MTLSLRDEYLHDFLPQDALDVIAPEIDRAYDTLMTKTGEGADFLGWLDLPVNYDKAEFARIEAAARKIRNTCDVFVVLGIGGSYLGARAAIEFLKTPDYNACREAGTPAIYFAGNNISTTALNNLIRICRDKDVCVNVISKSGTTTETAIAFRVFKNLLVEKYGEQGAKDRIFATTDKEKGTLKAYSDRSGFETFVVPDDVGGRYSVLTAVGLLPIAVAGIDIRSLMQGAADAREAYAVKDLHTNDAMKYAALRNLLLRNGKTTEVLVGYEPYMLMINEWWKQLYGESEGKLGRGIFPASVVFSTDLHSMGQYIQEGARNLFETVISVTDDGETFVIPNDEQNIDGLNFLAGMTLDHVNKQAMQATLLAHVDGGVPNILLTLEDRSAHSLGYLFYFFEFACALSGYTLGVNPFNQPGVESYKKNMFALLGKPGYEQMRADLQKRLENL